MNIMGWRAVVLSGREVGVAVWAVSYCAHGGRGQRERTTHEYYGVMVVLWGRRWRGGGGIVCARWKDSCAYGIEGEGRRRCW